MNKITNATTTMIISILHIVWNINYVSSYIVMLLYTCELLFDLTRQEMLIF